MSHYKKSVTATFEKGTNYWKLCDFVNAGIETRFWDTAKRYRITIIEVGEVDHDRLKEIRRQRMAHARKFVPKNIVEKS